MPAQAFCELEERPALIRAILFSLDGQKIGAYQKAGPQMIKYSSANQTIVAKLVIGDAVVAEKVICR
jgi:hypothetical protein